MVTGKAEPQPSPVETQSGGLAAACLGVPVGIIHDDCVSSLQVEAHTTSPDAQKEDEIFGFCITDMSENVEACSHHRPFTDLGNTSQRFMSGIAARCSPHDASRGEGNEGVHMRWSGRLL